MKNKGMPKLIEKSRRERLKKYIRAEYKLYYEPYSLQTMFVSTARCLEMQKEIALLTSTYEIVNRSFNEYKDLVKSKYEPKWYKRVYYKIKVFFKRIFRA